MSSEKQIEFTKENLDTYLKEVAKEYRKQIGKNMPAEMILIGGASILVNYGFRDMTTDIDAVIQSASVMKDVIDRVGDRYDLPNGWLNQDFVRTESYSPNLSRYSEYFRTYSNVLTVRTIAAEYLIAMKLRSGRLYKNDISDIVGILAAHADRGSPITEEQIKIAVTELYGGWDSIPTSSKQILDGIFKEGEYGLLYAEVANAEEVIRNSMYSFQKQYPGALKKNNEAYISNAIARDTKSVIEELKRAKAVSERMESDHQAKDDMER